ncbi:MAG TPA: hypothetical protein VNL71_20970, partial [Chloroflexota bacterium]|nr:hypothetical protein [Chloroflexota bacterium]
MNRSIRRIHVGSALVLLISLPLATGARAAVSLPPVLTQALQAMAAAHSYTITDSTISTNSFGTTSSSDVITVVRQGKVLEMSLVGKDRLEDGTTSFTAMVIGAKHTCIRRNGQGAWNCSLPSMGYLLTSATSFTSPATKTGHGTWAPAGNRIIRGQDCAGF